MLSISPAWSTPRYIRVVKPFIKITESPSENATLIYTTYQGIYFNVIDEKDNFYQVSTLEGTFGWINKNNVTDFLGSDPPPPFKTGIVNPAMTLASPEDTSPPRPEHLPTPSLTTSSNVSQAPPVSSNVSASQVATPSIITSSNISLIQSVSTNISISQVATPPLITSSNISLTLAQIATPSLSIVPSISISAAALQPTLNLPAKSTVTAPESYTKKLFNVMKQDRPEYEYPELPKNFNLDINGFYETRLSMRNFNPQNINDRRWDTIRNDPIYRKLPNDVLIGDPKLNIRYHIGIDGQINEKLSVHYDVEQEPDFPGVYDIRVKYDRSELTFHNLNAQFDNGEFVHVKKALNGVKATSYGNNWEAIMATGRQRSDPQKMETFGTGQKEIRLQNRPILEGSTQLYFNNRRLSEGRDFIVNYYEGLVRFTDITPQGTDFIKIIYEFTNPIEDFIPALSRKNFTGAQVKWKQDSPNQIQLVTKSKAEVLWPKSSTPTDNEAPKEFNLSVPAIKPSSEHVLLNGRELQRNKHYVIRNQKGKIVLTALELRDTDKLTISYDYYQTTPHLETLIGDNSVGPYILSKTQLLDDSETIYANDVLMQKGIDYDMDYIGGRIIFRYKVQYPTIISAEYLAIESTTVLRDVKDSPFSIGVTYLNESVNADEQSIINSITEVNVPKPTTNILTVSNFPLIPSKDIVIKAGTQNIAFAIENAYKGQIRILDPLPPRIPTLSVSYSYSKSFVTNFTFNTLQGKNGAWYTETDLNLRDTPIKYKGISEIRLFGPINGIEQVGNTFTKLEQNIDYVVNYDEFSSDPGVNIQIKFLTQIDSGDARSRLVRYPDHNNRVTLFYDYTPQTTPDEGNISQTMIGVTAGSKINNNWEVLAEVAAAEHNFSKPRVATASIFTGNGVLNHNYNLGKQNLVENSETVTIQEGFINTILTKDLNYFINYRNGTLRFKDINPSRNHIIRVNFEYFVSGATQAGQSSGYKLATKVMTAFKNDKIQANAGFKNIDAEFIPIGEIQESRGASIIEGSFKYSPTQNQALSADYRNQKLLRSTNATTGDSVYLTDEEIKGGARFSLFDTFDNTVKARVYTQVQDIKPGEVLHEIDNKTTEFDFGTNFGPDNFRNTLSFKLSNLESDYLDKLNLTETDINNMSYRSEIRFKKRKYLGNMSLDPSFYINSAETHDKFGNESNRLNSGYGASLWITPSATFKNQLQYTIDTIETETRRVSSGNSTVTKTANEIQNLLYDLRYDPTSWLSTHYQFNRKEDQSPISSQSGELNQTNLFEIGRFAPKGLLLQSGMSNNNIITKLVNNSFFTYSTRINQIEKNNNTSSTEFNEDKLSFNNFEPFRGVSLKRAFYETTNANGISIINSTTTSQNTNTRSTSKYGGELVIDNEWALFKHMTYLLTLEEYTEQREDRLIASSATSNITSEENPITKRFQKLTLKPRHIRAWLNRLIGRDIGLFNASIEERLDRIIRSRTSRDFRGQLSRTPIFTEDSNERKFLTFGGDYSPFNLFKLNTTLTSGDETYVRKNIASSASGSIFKSILNGTLGLGFSPFRIIDIDTTYTRNRVNQYRSSSINVSRGDIQNQLGSDLSASQLYNREETINSRLTFRTFKNIDLALGGRRTTITEIITTRNSLTNEIIQTGALAGIKYRYSSALSISVDSEFRQTEQKNGTNGNSTSITATTIYNLFRSKNFNIKIEHQLSQIQGIDINTLDKRINESGTGEVIRSVVTKQDYATQTGSISANIIFPLTNSPYIDNFTITAEGHIKSIKDNIITENSYDITGIILKGVLNF